MSGQMLSQTLTDVSLATSRSLDNAPPRRRNNNHSNHDHNHRHKINKQDTKVDKLEKVYKPLFGIDIGSSLVRLVFFDPYDSTGCEEGLLRRLRSYLTDACAYGTTGRRDSSLELADCCVGDRRGTLHFINFSAEQLGEFVDAIRESHLTKSITDVHATGGGSYKLAQSLATKLSIKLHLSDKLDSTIAGVHFLKRQKEGGGECYYLQEPLNDSTLHDARFDVNRILSQCANTNTNTTNNDQSMRLVKIPYNFTNPYPYLLVTIGSGISVILVRSQTTYTRLTGSNIGGGTFLGLCSLLCDCHSFEEAINLAQAGSSQRIDKLVKDIYGGDYTKFNLSGELVASSFGNMNLADRQRSVSAADLARATLEMVTLNCGLLARTCATSEHVERVVFSGNFLRNNCLSAHLLSYALGYWSQGTIRTLFLEHDGYFGAVGCLVSSLTSVTEDVDS